MRSILGVLTFQWRLKLAAFALAMLLWITVSADQIAVRWLPVPVEVQVRDENHRLVRGPDPEEVEVRFSGPGRELWELAISRPPLRLVVRDASAGVQEFSLEPGQVQIPRGRAISAVDVRPANVRLAFERVASTQVPVQVQVRNGVRTDYTLVDTLQVDPPRVRISGPADQINTVEAVVTRPLDLSDEEGAFERRVALDTTGLGGLQLSTQEVVVSGRIERAVEQTISGLTVQTPPGVIAIPGTVDLTLAGAESVLRRVGRDVPRVVVPSELVPAQIPPLGVEVPVRVERLPSGVQAVPEPRTVRLIAAPELPTPEIRGAVPRLDADAPQEPGGQ